MGYGRTNHTNSNRSTSCNLKRSNKDLGGRTGKEIRRERLDGLLPEALAWIPQSSVANYIDRVWLRIHDHIPEVQVLLQVHDSLCGQFPTHLKHPCLARMREEAAKVVIPYDDPLVIPVGIKTSDKSWGACE